MRKAILSLILSISVTLAPISAMANPVDPLSGFWLYLPVIMAVLASYQGTGVGVRWLKDRASGR